MDYELLYLKLLTLNRRQDLQENMRLKEKFLLLNEKQKI